MTVSYQSDVASSTSGGLIKLLWRWRGSVWKLVYRELMIFVIVFLGLSLAYRYLFTERLKRSFEYLVIFCSAFVDMIPLSFILGFYVSFTATRWWNQYTAIPWPDKLMNNIAMYVPGNDDTSRMLRRTLMRYLNLTLVLVLRSISIAVKRRFPTKEHLVEAGIMTKQELDMHISVPSTEFNTFWIPCTWFVNLLREARQECRITDSSGLKLIMEEFNDFRSKCGLLWSYDWVSIPLVYTQVVTIATYAFFIASIFGRQAIEVHPKVFNVDIEHRYEPYIPVFTILQFLLYMGLLKLGEQLINPFGDDDEDFELNWIIDRHLKVSFLGVDILNGGPPPMVKDNYWDDWDIKLPYTAAAVTYKKKTYRGSMATYHVPSEQQNLVVPEFTEDEECDYDTVSDTLSRRNKSSSSIFGSVFGAKFNPPTHKRNESLLSLNSDNFDFEQQWRTSTASFFMVNDEQNIPSPTHALPRKQDSDDSEKPTIATVTVVGGKETLMDKGFNQGIRGDISLARKRPRKSSDQTSITIGSTGSGNEDRSSEHGANMSSMGSVVGTSSTNKDNYFDTPIGTFNNKPRNQANSPIRRPSNSSLLRSYLNGKEMRGSLTGSGGGAGPVTPASSSSPPSGRTFQSTGSEPSSPQTTIAYDVTVSRSSSSASRKTIKSAKPGLLKLAKPDSRLKIKPFVKSRVTFSDDTKSEYNKKHLTGYYRYIDQARSPVDLTLSSPDLSEADLLNIFTNKNRHIATRRASAMVTPTVEQAIIDDTSRPVLQETFIRQIPGSSSSSSQQLSSIVHRRTSYDQVNDVYSETSTVSSQNDFWLRHQSLPNIQEIVEESPHQSPTSTEGGADFGLFRIGSRKGRPSATDGVTAGGGGGGVGDAGGGNNGVGGGGGTSGVGGSCDFPKSCTNQTVFKNTTGSDSVFCCIAASRYHHQQQQTTISSTTATSSAITGGGGGGDGGGGGNGSISDHHKTHLCRQPEIEEDICGDPECPLSASEKRNRFSKDSADSGNSLATGSGSHLNLSLSRCSLGRSGKGKGRCINKGSNNGTSKQSSTDSESGSYATACSSVFVSISEEDVKRLLHGNRLSMNSTDSSISSFSSAKDSQFNPGESLNSLSQLLQQSSSSQFTGDLCKEIEQEPHQIADEGGGGGGGDGGGGGGGGGGGNDDDDDDGEEEDENDNNQNDRGNVLLTSLSEQSAVGDNLPKIIVLPTSPSDSQMDISKLPESGIKR